MALHARKALADCESAYQLLRNEKKDSPTWRIHWVACLALLRAVGHVLDKVDGDVDARHRRAIRAKWDQWKADETANAIFWRFIEVERNNLLKEYRFGVEPKPTYIFTEEGNSLVTEEGSALVAEDDFFRLSHVGFEDREGRDVIRFAIEWWGQQLDAIEAQLRAP